MNFVKFVLGINKGAEKKEEQEVSEGTSENPGVSENDVKLTPEEIRLKRLEKFQSSSPKEPEKVLEEEVKSPNEIKKEVEEKERKEREKKEMVKKEEEKKEKEKVKIEIKPSALSKITQEGGKKKEKKNYFHLYVKKILNLTDTGASTESEDQPKEYSRKILEHTLLKKIKSLSINESVFSYLTACYNTIKQMKEKLNILKNRQKEEKKIEGFNTKISHVKHIEELILNYFGILFCEKKFFPKSTKVEGVVALLECWLDPRVEDAQYFHIFDVFLKNYEKDEEKIKNAIFTLVDELSKRMRRLTLLDENKYLIPLRLFEKLTKRKEVRKILVKHPKWISGRTGKALEHWSVLGPFFKLTCSVPTVGRKIFQAVKTLTVKQLHALEANMNIKMKVIHDTLHAIILNFLKPKETREDILKWFAAVIEGNESRGKLIDNTRTSSSDGFMINFVSVLLRLTTPFVDVKKKKFKDITPEFVMLNELIDFKEFTKLAVGISDAKEKYKDKELGEVKLMTKMFFFTIKALHISMITSLRFYGRLFNDVNNLRVRYNLLSRLPQRTSEFLMIERSFHDLTIQKWSLETHLLDTHLNDYVLAFYRFMCTFIFKLMNPKNLPFKLPEEVPQEYAVLPEFFITDFVDHILSVMRFKPKLLYNHSYNELLDILICILGNKKYMSNPNERAKFTTIFLNFAPNKKFKDYLTQVLLNNSRANKYLMECLINVYIEVEHMDNSYYVKHKPRFEISNLIKVLWKYPNFKASFIKQTETGKGENFLLFFNMNINDATLLLDESLRQLKEIHDYELMVGDVVGWGKRSIRERRELEDKNNKNRNQVTINMQLANSTVDMLNFISKDLPHPFLRDELVGRISEMLNFFLAQLTDDAKNFNVSNKKKLNFQPKELLTRITDIYMNFSSYEKFIEAVAKDERSFRPKVFEKTSRILRDKIKTKTGKYIEGFDVFALRAMEFKEKFLKEEEDLGEIPEEFLDEITYILMIDPVKLPSGKVVDRKTIERHLLNDKNDPFSRQKLTSDMLVPLPELKKKIEEFKKSKKS